MSETIGKMTTAVTDSWTRIVDKITSGRWLMTVFTIGTACWCVARGIELPTWFVAIVSSVSTFYFTTRPKEQ